MEQPDIRPVRAPDHAGWMSLWDGYQVFYQADIAPVTATVWARLLDPQEPVAGAVAVLGETCIGLVHWVLHRSTWSIADTCYLQDLFVAPAHRGAGIGAALIRHVYAEAARAGCADVYWLTHEHNVTARRLYDRIATRSGFVQYQHGLQSPPAE